MADRGDADVHDDGGTMTIIDHDDNDNHYLKALDIIFTHGKFPEGSSHCGHQLFVAMVLRLLFDCHHHHHYCDDDDDDDDDDDGQSVDLP